MPIQSKASLDFVLEEPSEKSTLGVTITYALGENTAMFPNLPVAVTDLQQVNNNLISAIAAASTGNFTAKANLTDVEEDWDEAFRLTANYVSTVAAGSEVIILTAGFTPTKNERQGAQLPPMLPDFEVTFGKGKGCFTARSKGIPGAKAYVYTAVPNGVSISYDANKMIIAVGTTKIYVVVNTRKGVEFANMPSGEQLNLSAYAINAAGSGPASNGETVIPQ